MINFEKNLRDDAESFWPSKAPTISWLWITYKKTIHTDDTSCYSNINDSFRASMASIRESYQIQQELWTSIVLVSPV